MFLTPADTYEKLFDVPENASQRGYVRHLIRKSGDYPRQVTEFFFNGIFQDHVVKSKIDLNSYLPDEKEQKEEWLNRLLESIINKSVDLTGYVRLHQEWINNEFFIEFEKTNDMNTILKIILTT